MRLFIAIDCKELEDYFKELQAQIPTDIAKIKTVNTFHLTLKFLGDVFEEKVEDVKAALSSIKFKPFKLKLDKIGVFPSEGYIRVVWIGLKDDDHLSKLQKDVELVLDKFHFRRDFEFMPHLTLARVKFINEKEKFVESLKKIEVEEKEVEVKEFKLIKSELTKQGPIYTDLGVFHKQ